ncbi:MAG: hypothetical protein MJ123_11840 [Lachnospiraceae bacterium]|nr:hypothetical protein [Lachnospiraceae bacterium]
MAALFYNDQVFQSTEEMNEYLLDQIGVLNDELRKSKETLECNVKNHSEEIKRTIESIKEKDDLLFNVQHALENTDEKYRNLLNKCASKDEEINELNAEINALVEKLEKKNNKIRKLEKIITKLTMKIIK